MAETLCGIVVHHNKQKQCGRIASKAGNTFVHQESVVSGGFLQEFRKVKFNLAFNARLEPVATLVRLGLEADKTTVEAHRQQARAVEVLIANELAKPAFKKMTEDHAKAVTIAMNKSAGADVEKHAAEQIRSLKRKR